MLSLNDVVDFIVTFVERSGYLGIFLMTVIEGTLIPIPSELTLIPAGVLASEGKMDLATVLFVSTLGNFIGSAISYYWGAHYGRRFVEKYGRYVFFTPQKLQEVQEFFKKYGSLSIFLGRILPGFKHFISFPAGVVHMDFKVFSLYSFCGGAIWVGTLVLSGYFFADKLALLRTKIEYLNSALLVIVVLCLVVWLYRVFNRRKER